MSLTCFRAYFLPVRAKDLSAPRYIVICNVSGCTIVFQVISRRAWFSEKDTEHEICFYFLYIIYPIYYSIKEQLSKTLSQMYIGLHINYSLFFSDTKQAWMFSANLKKISYLISWKPVQWEPSCSMLTDRRTGNFFIETQLADRNDDANSW